MRDEKNRWRRKEVVKKEVEEQVSGESVVSDYDKSHLGQKKRGIPN